MNDFDKTFKLAFNNSFLKIKLNCDFHVGRSSLVGQRPMKSFSSVRPSVRPSLNFLKIISLFFSDIVHDDS